MISSTVNFNVCRINLCIAADRKRCEGCEGAFVYVNLGWSQIWGLLMTSMMKQLLGCRAASRRLALFVFAVLVLPAPAFSAGGYTSSVVPTGIEFVQNQGFVIWGAFGNSGSTLCGTNDRIFISVSHPQYQALLSTAMTAVASGAKLQAYIHSCTMVGWYGLTVNEVGPSGSLALTR